MNIGNLFCSPKEFCITFQHILTQTKINFLHLYNVLFRKMEYCVNLTHEKKDITIFIVIDTCTLDLSLVH